LAFACGAAIVVVIAMLEARRAAVVVVCLVVFEMVLLAPHGFYADRRDPYPSTEWLRYLSTQTAKDHSRVFSTDGILFPDTAGVYRLSDPRMLDALYVKRYWQYLRAFVSHGLEDRFIATTFTETAPAIAANQMFDLLGVRYVVFRDSSPGPPSWSAPQYELVYRGEGVKIYRNTHVAPRAFVVHDVIPVADQAAALRFLRSGEATHFPDGSIQVNGKDLQASAVIERGGRGPVALGDCTSTGDQTKIVDRRATKVVVQVKSACPGLLVLSDTYYPGWTASVNGRGASIYPTDVAFRGVAVPKGVSTVTFEYRPSAFRAGLLMTLVGVLVIVALGVAGVFSSRWWIRRSSRATEGDGHDPSSD
jgi:hypothetical protein